VELKVDWVGFVLAASKRQVDLNTAAKLIRKINKRCVCVAVSYADDPFEANQIEDLGFDLWQIHRIKPDQSSRFQNCQLPCLRAQSFNEGLPLTQLNPPFQAYLLDAAEPGAGQTWDWSKLKAAKPESNFLLAGGLTPENVVKAIQAVHPWGVDVSSGVESSPGIKCREKMRQFVERAREAFASNS
jgi:phosphoribosylanthranilate isomerase